MEFLVEFEVNVPDGTPESEVKDRERAEASAAAKLVDQGHLARLWKPPVAPGETKTVGLYRADSEAHLDGLLGRCRSASGCMSPLPRSGPIPMTLRPRRPPPADRSQP